MADQQNLIVNNLAILDGFRVNSKLKFNAKIFHTEVRASGRANEFRTRFIIKVNALIVEQTVLFLLFPSLLPLNQPFGI